MRDFSDYMLFGPVGPTFEEHIELGSVFVCVTYPDITGKMDFIAAPYCSEFMSFMTLSLSEAYRPYLVKDIPEGYIVRYTGALNEESWNDFLRTHT